MPKTTGFHHVALKVHDYDKAIAFYKALGFSEKLDWGADTTRGILLDAGDGNYIEIFAGGPDAGLYSQNPQPTWGENQAITHIAFRTDDVPGMTTLAEKAGAKITMQPKTIQMGRPEKNNGVGGQVPITISFVQAPTGEMLEFFSNPKGAL